MSDHLLIGRRLRSCNTDARTVPGLKERRKGNGRALVMNLEELFEGIENMLVEASMGGDISPMQIKDMLMDIRVEVGRMLAKRAAQITAAGQCAICHQPLPPLCRECEAEELNRARDHRDELIHYHTVSVGRG